MKTLVLNSFRSYRIIGVVFVVMGSLFAFSDVRGDGDVVEERIISVYHHPNPNLLDGFGMSITGNENEVLIGAPHKLIRGRETGVAYMFDGQTQQLKYTFAPPRSNEGALFGQTVVLTDQFVVIGAPHERDEQGTQTGAVYVFDRKTSERRLTLFSPYPTNGSFGHAVAVRDNRIIVGDPLASTPTTFNAGAAYVYDATSGELLHTLLSPEAKAGHPDRFGHAVAFSGPYVLVGSPLGGTTPVDSGIVFLFDDPTGQLVTSFSASTLKSGDAFGWALSTVDNFLLVGAFGHKGIYREEGIACLFDMKTKQLIRTFKNPIARERAHFGKAVAILHQMIAIAAPTERVEDSMNISGGVVYLFDRTTGEFQHALKAPGSSTGASDHFGHSLAPNGEHLLIGAPFDGKEKELDAGLVYRFKG